MSELMRSFTSQQVSRALAGFDKAGKELVFGFTGLLYEHSQVTQYVLNCRVGGKLLEQERNGRWPRLDGSSHARRALDSRAVVHIGSAREERWKGQVCLALIDFELVARIGELRKESGNFNRLATIELVLLEEYLQIFQFTTDVTRRYDGEDASNCRRFVR